MTLIDRREQLARLVGLAPGSLVLPDRPRGAGAEVPTPLRLVDALELRADLWLAVIEDAAGGCWAAPLVAPAGAVRRAVAGDGAAAALAGRLAGPGSRTPGRFEITSWHAEPVTGERAITVDQTNDSVVVGERAVVKWSVRLPRDPAAAHPAAARIETLVARGFTGIPRPWGQLRRRNDHGVPVVLAGIAAFLPGAVDGWEWAVDDVGAATRGELAPAQALAPASTLGVLTAELHLALASNGQQPAGPDRIAGWGRRAREDLATAVSLVDGPEGERLRARQARIASSFGAFAATVGTPLIEVHGDLHVGQVLRSGRPPEYAIIDFDGNPVLPEAERVQRQPAALDVAGMLASLDHVGRVVLRRTDGAGRERITSWIAQAQQAFLHSYRGTLAAAGAGALLDERLLLPLRLQQECREFLYAARHLPHWRYVPDAALIELLPDLTQE